MTFLNPLWLIVAALAIAVLALHARKRRLIDVPSVILWRLLDTGSPHRRLTRPPLTLLLILQLLVVVIVALALAQPFFGPEPTPVHRIYVLDASASMRATDVGPSRFEAAVAALRNEIAATPDDGSRVSVVTAGLTAAVAVARQSEPDGMLPIVDRVTATDGTADWAGVSALIPSLVRPGEETRIVVLSDGADEGVEALAAAGLPVDRLVFATASVGNLGLTATIEPVDVAAGSWRISGTIAGAGADFGGTTLAVRFLPEGGDGLLDWAQVPVATPAFAFDVAVGRAGAIVVSLPDDAGPADNRVQFVVDDAPREARVLYLGPGGNPLLRAFQALDDVAVFEGAGLPVDEEAFDLVVLDNVIINRAPATSSLWIGAAHATGDIVPRAFAVAFPSDWQADHPLSTDIDWSTLRLDSAYLAPPLAGAEIVLEAGETPLIEARTTPFGRQVRVAFPIAGTSLADSPLLPLFARNLIDWLGITPGAVSAACSVGAPCPIEARFGALPVDRIDGIEDAEIRVPSTGFVPDRAGLYRVGSANGGLLLAVNGPAGESALAPVLSATIEPAGGASWERDVWWWLAAAALLLLVIEAWRAGRGEERFLRVAGLTARDPLAGRRRLLLALRLATLALVVAALAGLPLVTPTHREDVVLVAGADPAVAAAGYEALSAGVVAAGGAGAGAVNAAAPPRVAADLSPTVAVPAGEADEAAEEDLAAALQLATAMLPADRPGRALVAAGGAERAILDAAASLALRGIAVDVLAPPEVAAGEVLVASVSAPNGVRAGDSFPLQAAVYAASETEAEITISRNGEVITTTQATLRSGTNRIDATIPDAAAGETVFEVAVSAAGDAIVENNRSGVVVTAAPAANVVIITPDVSWGEYLAEALAIQNLDADVILPSAAPWDLAGWLAYDVVVTMNLPALDLDTRQQNLLEEAVRDHGRSLLILGGENSFGPGGYYETAFERLSPLSSRTPQDAPESAIIFVLDRSGSMQAAVQGGTRLDMAKAATLGAIDLLEDNTEVGVIVFDSEPQVVVPLQAKDNVTRLDTTVRTIQAGGGTALIPALGRAVTQAEGSEAAIRHIVLLTDGLSDPGDYFSILQRARTGQITISTIAIGQGADAVLLRQIANIGGGAFSETGDFNALPSIMSREALLLAGSPVRNQSTRPFWVDRGQDFLDGLPDELPLVRTYVVTTAKPEADIHLAVADTDGTTVPLMASWRVGSGRVLAFTSHGAGAGTRDWLNMADFPRFWAQILRHFVPEVQRAGLHVQLDQNGSAILVTADLVDDAEGPVTGAVLSASLSSAADATVNVVLTETRPGRYQGALRAAGPGTYGVAVDAGTGETARASVLIPYPERFDFSRDDGEVLAALAAASGGRVLGPGDEVFVAPSVWMPQPGWWLWLALAVALFMLDLTIRYAPRLLGFGRKAARTTPDFEETGARPDFMPRRAAFVAAPPAAELEKV